MKNYIKLMLGAKSAHAAECFAGGFIGADFGIKQDLSNSLPDTLREFNQAFIPLYLATNPGKTRIGAGLAGGALWTVAKWLSIGDMVVCPDGTNKYRVGEVVGAYYHEPGGVLPHRRKVAWLPRTVDRAEMSDALRRSAASSGTMGDVSKYHEELQRLIGGGSAPTLLSADPSVEDPSAFALEGHLEDFLVENWAHTLLGKDYDIYEEDGEIAQQYQTDTGPLDLLAISKDKRRLLVVELKKGRASDAVVGQTLRYMSFVKDELAEDGQEVLGAIIAQEDDVRLRRAIALTPSISFYKYQVSFKLVKS